MDESGDLGTGCGPAITHRLRLDCKTQDRQMGQRIAEMATENFGALKTAFSVMLRSITHTKAPENAGVLDRIDAHG